MFEGIDGGTAKTAGVLLDERGRLLARHVVGGLVFPDRPSPEDGAVLRELVRELSRQAGVPVSRVRFCALGLCGVDTPGQFAAQLEAVRRATGIDTDRLALVNDAIVALWGATDAPASAILQHGSGFTAAWRATYGQETLFDHLNAGRTFDFRTELLSLVARMIDGRAEPTPLKEKLLAHLGVPSEADYAEAVWRRKFPGKNERHTAPLVFEAWRAGDPAADMLLRRAADDYVLSAWAMLARIGCADARISFGGGVLARAPAQFWELLADGVHRRYPDVTVAPPELAPESGAAVMAAFRAGLDPVTFFRNVRERGGACGGGGRS